MPNHDRSHYVYHANGQIDTLATWKAPAATLEYLPTSVDYAYRSLKDAKERFYHTSLDYDDRIQRAWDRWDYNGHKRLKEQKEIALERIRGEIRRFQEEYDALR